MSLPTAFPLAFTAGDNFVADFQIVDEAGTPIDFSDNGSPSSAVVTSQIRVSSTDPTVAETFTATWVDQVTGKIRLALDQTQTRGLVPQPDPSQNYVYDVDILDKDNFRFTYINGGVQVQQDVTKP